MLLVISNTKDIIYVNIIWREKKNYVIFFPTNFKIYHPSTPRIVNNSKNQ